MSKFLQIGSKLLTRHLSAVTTAQSSRVISSTSKNNQEPNQSAQNFLNGSSTTYIEEMYTAWQQDPTSVHKSWDIYFRTNSTPSAPPPTLGADTAALSAVGSSDLTRILQLLENMPAGGGKTAGDSVYHATAGSSEPVEKLIEDHLKLYALIRSYQVCWISYYL